MSIEKFQVLESTCLPLPVENVDTDQIIPARFLKATTRKGFGENLFRDWRYGKHNKPIKDFVLNNQAYSGKILIAGKNFGSGSSREHAAWAIYDYGIKAVVSSFFADIFKNNALNNGLLPVQVSEGFLYSLLTSIEEDPRVKIRIDLQAQKITNLSSEASEIFEINSHKKKCLLNGFDDIDYLINLREKITEFENKQHLRTKLI